jgi:Uma2 family endonuclease
MVIQAKYMTVEEFDAFVQRAENIERLFEYIGGEVVEVVSNNYSSVLGMFIGSAITMFVEERALGYVTGADGGYMVSGERYIPDAAYISKTRQPEPCHEAYNPNAPDLAVEVLSPTNAPDSMRIKVVNYLLAGTTVWVVDPDKKQVEVYVPNQSPKTVGMDETLEGGAVLPDFKLAVSRIFAR